MDEKNIFSIKELTVNDGKDIYDMLQDMANIEFGFTNPIAGKSYQEFQLWLEEQRQWASGQSLPEGYVPQTSYWLYVNETPVGWGKIRHRLTLQLYKNGGNIGYCISPKYRGRGYGNILLRELIKKAKYLGINKIVLTIMKKNYASIKVAESNGGVQKEKDDEWFYYTFE